MIGAESNSAPPCLEAAPMGAAFLLVAPETLQRRPALPCSAMPKFQEERMSHKYKIHQLVRMTHPNFADKRASSSGIYEVTRLMPADQTGEVSYRIKSSGFGERAVRESEISARVSMI
jgi:hypothetical protein